MELVVALVIVGVAAAMALPRIGDIADQNRVLRGVQAMQIEVQQAFAIAGRNRAPVTVRWNSATVELRVADLSGAVIYRRAALQGYGLKAADVAVTPAVLTVFPNGIAGDSLVVRVTRRGRSKSLHVTRAGMVRLR